MRHKNAFRNLGCGVIRESRVQAPSFWIPHCWIKATDWHLSLLNSKTRVLRRRLSIVPAHEIHLRSVSLSVGPTACSKDNCISRRSNTSRLRQQRNHRNFPQQVFTCPRLVHSSVSTFGLLPGHSSLQSPITSLLSPDSIHIKLRPPSQSPGFRSKSYLSGHDSQKNLGEQRPLSTHDSGITKHHLRPE